MDKTIKTQRLTLKMTNTEDNVITFSIFTAHSAEQVGVASIEIIKEDSSAGLDIYIHAGYRRLGYGLEAGDVLIGEIIKSYPKYEIIAAVPGDDTAANRFCERLDFIFGGSYEDENINLYYM